MCSLEGSFGVFVFARGLSFVFLCPFGGFLWSLEGFPFVVLRCFDSRRGITDTGCAGQPERGETVSHNLVLAYRAPWKSFILNFLSIVWWLGLALPRQRERNNAEKKKEVR